MTQLGRTTTTKYKFLETLNSQKHILLPSIVQTHMTLFQIPVKFLMPFLKFSKQVKQKYRKVGWTDAKDLLCVTITDLQIKYLIQYTY